MTRKPGLTVPTTEEPLGDETERMEHFEESTIDPEVLALLDEGADPDADLEEEEGDDDSEAMSSEEKVRLIASVADAVKAEDIVALDVRELTIITDFFLICTGKSSIQIRAIADRIEDKLRELGERKQRIEGRQEATWILMDYGDVVVHVMAAEQRAFYRLEALWHEAPQLELDLLPT